MLYHLWVRITILPGGMSVHDHHHLFSKDQKDWANATFARQRQVEGGAKLIEVWGLGNAIEKVFQSFANAPAVSFSETTDSDQ